MLKSSLLLPPVLLLLPTGASDAASGRLYEGATVTCDVANGRRYEGPASTGDAAS
jgi:hypothetical protein